MKLDASDSLLEAVGNLIRSQQRNLSFNRLKDCLVMKGVPRQVGSLACVFTCRGFAPKQCRPEDKSFTFDVKDQLVARETKDGYDLLWERLILVVPKNEKQGNYWLFQRMEFSAPSYDAYGYTGKCRMVLVDDRNLHQYITPLCSFYSHLWFQVGRLIQESIKTCEDTLKSLRCAGGSAVIQWAVATATSISWGFPVSDRSPLY